jgi:hypothetical protein
VVSRLERTHSALVEAIIEIPWTTMDSAIVKSYIHFTGMLLSARPEYLSLVLGNITHRLTHRSSFSSLPPRHLKLTHKHQSLDFKPCMQTFPKARLVHLQDERYTIVSTSCSAISTPSYQLYLPHWDHFSSAIFLTSVRIRSLRLPTSGTCSV